MFLLENYDLMESNNIVDIENGGIYEVMIESELAVHNIFESMYEMDMKEILEVTDEKEDIKSSNNKVTSSGMKAKLKAALATMKKAILTVLNSLLNFIDKMRFNNDKFIKKYDPIIQKMNNKDCSIEIEGYNFSNDTSALDLKSLMYRFYSTVGGTLVDLTDVYSDDERIGEFKKKADYAIELIKLILCENKKTNDNTKDSFEDRIHVAVFGSKNKVKLVINAKDALADIDMYLKNRIENLRKQKAECDNVFNKFIKDVGGKDVSNLPKITDLFISYINQIKTLYIKTLNEFIKATKANIVQCQTVVKIAAKKASVND